MKINYLKLVNFIHIYTGLNKNIIELDLRKNNKIINIIIGKMGSCKSVILGHLQPFPGFGTLDARSQDGIIIDGEHGEKIIEYKKDENIYRIQHKYIWKNGKHTIRSFIKKNDVELNQNGNITSFKEIIEFELGISISDLSMIRLGPNVTNIIDMSAAERKSYMASRLKDTEMYSMIYKKLNEEMRNLNARATVLSTKISSLLKNTSPEKIKEEKDYLMENLKILNNGIYNTNNTIGELKAIIKRIGNVPLSTYSDEILLYEKKLNEMKSYVKMKEMEIDDIQSRFHSLNEVSEKLGALKYELRTLDTFIMKTESEHDSEKKKLKILKEKNIIVKDSKQIENLKKTYEELESSISEIKMEISDFRCKYSTTQIRALFPQINMINELISDISIYNTETVNHLLYKGQSALHSANKKIDQLNAKRLSLHRKLSNLKFADKYEVMQKLYFPPFCPTKSCPYYKTHPSNIKMSNEKEKLSVYNSIQIEIEKCDQDINILTEYPMIFSKIQSLKNIWSDTVLILKDIGAVKTESIVKVFSNIFSQKWYDHDILIDVLNRCTKRDKYYELVERSKEMQSELMEYMKEDFNSTLSEIGVLEKSINIKINNLSEAESRKKILKSDLETTEMIYQKLMNVEKLIVDVRMEKEKICKLEEKIENMKKNFNDASNAIFKIQELEKVIKNNEKSIKDINNRITEINVVLNDIDYSQKEYFEVQEAQSYLKEIVEAVSSNKGIPLLYVKLFLNQCKDTINDLISDVFGDTIEILDFNISETDFKIPYSINGSDVKDISSASQGQRSIISLALSFALVRQSMEKYNIMLLDEMDGPLYSADREKFISILFKQIQAIGAEQIFIISHNNTFDGHNVNVIMTTDEHVDKSNQLSIIRL